MLDDVGVVSVLGPVKPVGVTVPLPRSEPERSNETKLVPHRGVETAVMSLSSSSSEMILMSRVVAPFMASRHNSRKDRERDLRPSVPLMPLVPGTGSVPVESAKVELGSLCAFCLCRNLLAANFENRVLASPPSAILA